MADVEFWLMKERPQNQARLLHSVITWSWVQAVSSEEQRALSPGCHLCYLLWTGKRHIRLARCRALSRRIFMQTDVAMLKGVCNNFRVTKCKHVLCVCVTHTCGPCVNVLLSVVRNSLGLGMYLWVPIWLCICGFEFVCFSVLFICSTTGKLLPDSSTNQSRTNKTQSSEAHIQGIGKGRNQAAMIPCDKSAQQLVASEFTSVNASVLLCVHKDAYLCVMACLENNRSLPSGRMLGRWNTLWWCEGYRWTLGDVPWWWEV